MSNEKLKGGKADNMSVNDIAKLHGVSPKSIEKEIEVAPGKILNLNFELQQK